VFGLGRGSLIAWHRTAVKGLFMRRSDGVWVVSREGVSLKGSERVIFLPVLSDLCNRHNRKEHFTSLTSSLHHLCCAQHADVTYQSPIFPILASVLFHPRLTFSSTSPHPLRSATPIHPYLYRLHQLLICPPHPNTTSLSSFPNLAQHQGGHACVISCVSRTVRPSFFRPTEIK
jgi:hypothetical protein